MGWLSKLREKFSGDKTSQFHTGAPDPKFLGDFLVNEFLSNHFGLKEEQFQQFASELPDELKDSTKLWTLFYLSWLFQLYALSKYGREFSDQLLAQAAERFKKAASLMEGAKGLVSAINFWFEQLDDCTSRIGTEVEGVEVPLEVFVAIAFLTLDHNSPYYKNPETNGVDLDVAAALASAKDAAVPWIQNSFNFF